MNIGITGASGFIGQHLSKHLVASGHRVTAFVRRIDSTPGDEMTQVQHLELQSENPIPGCPEKLECLVHLAGLAHGKTPANAGNGQGIYDAINATASIRVARDAARLNVRRFVYLSSISVYGHALLSTGREICEDHSPMPSEPYGESKLKAERALTQLAEKVGMELVIVRPALVVGPQAPGNLEILSRLIGSGYPVPVGRPPNERSYIGRSDLVDLLEKCISLPVASGEVFLAADPVRVSTENVVRKIAEGMGKAALVIPVPKGIIRLAGRITGRSSFVDKIVGDLRIDSTKAIRILDWKPAGSLLNDFMDVGRSFVRR